MKCDFSNFSSMRVSAWIFGLAIMVLLVAPQAGASAQEAKYQSVFMYNFSKYIKWPDAYVSDHFVIGVLGDNRELYEHLVQMSETKKSANGLPIEIVQYRTIGDIGRCHMLFISSNYCDQIKQVKQAIANMPVLTITDVPGMAKKGSVINFVNKGDNIKFELNMDRARECGLMVAGSLASLAILL